MTAVEELYKIWLFRNLTMDDFEQAKAMEKEQIIQSYYAAVVDTEMIHEHKKFIYEGPEQYYNETYKK
jgi:hypothetical protein